jgi:hypothetical protein
VGRELVHGRRVNGRQSVLVYCYVFARQSNLNLARFVSVRSGLFFDAISKSTV